MGNAANGKPLHWALPSQGFAVDGHAEADGNPAVAPQLTSVTGGVTQVLLVGGAWLPEGKLAWRWSTQIGDAQLPIGAVELDVALGDHVVGIVVQVADRSPATDPFEAIDPWLLTFSRDTGSVQVAPLGDAATARNCPSMAWTVRACLVGRKLAA